MVYIGVLERVVTCEGDTLHLVHEKGSCSAEIYICVTVFVKNGLPLHVNRLCVSLSSF